MKLVNESGMYIAEEIRGRKKTRSGRYLYKIKWKFWPESDCTWEPIENLTSVLDNVEEYDKLYMKNKLLKRLGSSSKASKEVKQNMMKSNSHNEEMLQIFGIEKHADKKEEELGEENVEERSSNQIIEEQENLENEEIKQCEFEPKIKHSFQSQQMSKENKSKRSTEHKVYDPFSRLKKNIKKLTGIAQYNKKYREEKEARQRLKNKQYDIDNKEKESLQKNTFQVFKVGGQEEFEEVKIGEIDKNKEDINDGEDEGKGEGKLSLYRDNDFPKYQSIIKALLEEYKVNELTIISNSIRKLNIKRSCLRKTVKYNETKMHENINNSHKIEEIDESEEKLFNSRLIIKADPSGEVLTHHNNDMTTKCIRERIDLETDNSQVISKTKFINKRTKSQRNTLPQKCEKEHENNEKKMENNESNAILEMTESDFYTSLREEKDEEQQSELKLSDFLKFRFKQPFNFDDSIGQESSDENEENELNEPIEFFQPRIVMKEFSSVNPVRNLLKEGGQYKIIRNFEKYSNKIEESNYFCKHGGFRKYKVFEENNMIMEDIEEETPQSQNETDFKQPVIKIKQMIKQDNAPEKTTTYLSLKTELIKTNSNRNNIERQHFETAKIAGVKIQPKFPFELIKQSFLEIKKPRQKLKEYESFRKKDKCAKVRRLKQQRGELGPASLIEQFSQFSDQREYTIQIGTNKKVEICMRNEENELCEFLVEDLEKSYEDWVKMFYESFI